MSGMMDDLANQHEEMLAELKRQFTKGGEIHLWNMIHRIDPRWPNPWHDPENVGCTCPPIGISKGCPIHGAEPLEAMTDAA